MLAPRSGKCIGGKVPAYLTDASAMKAEPRNGGATVRFS